MKSLASALTLAFGFAAALMCANAGAQSAADTVEAHVAAAKAASGPEQIGPLNLCNAPAPARGRGSGGDAAWTS